MHASGSRGQARCTFLIFGVSAVRIPRSGGRRVGFSADPCTRQLWYAWQRAGRTSAINFDRSRFRPPNFPQRGAGGRVAGGSLKSAVARLVCMPAGREEKPAELFYFVSLPFRRSNFPERKAKGGVSGGFLQSVVALLVCMPAGREGGHAHFVLALPLYEIYGAGGGGKGFHWISTLGSSGLGMHASGSGGRARSIFFQ